MPARWRDGGLSDFAGRVRFRRRFGYPGQIDATERVWLTGTAVAGRGRVVVNGVPRLDGVGPGAWEVDVTGDLRERNELVVDVEGGVDGGLPGEIALEVRATAYLRNVVAEANGGEWGVRGEVVGTADGLLEVYLIADRSPVNYRALNPTDLPQRFELTTPVVREDGAAVGRLVVELVRGAVAWYTVEVVSTAAPDEGSGR